MMHSPVNNYYRYHECVILFFLSSLNNVCVRQSNVRFRTTANTCWPLLKLLLVLTKSLHEWWCVERLWVESLHVSHVVQADQDSIPFPSPIHSTRLPGRQRLFGYSVIIHSRWSLYQPASLHLSICLQPPNLSNWVLKQMCSRIFLYQSLYFKLWDELRFGLRFIYAWCLTWF